MAPGRPQDPVRPDMLPPEIGASAPASLPGENGEEIMSLPLREAREVFERQYLEALVMRFGGNISRTASFVGMERSAPHRKLRSLGVGSTERASVSIRSLLIHESHHLRRRPGRLPYCALSGQIGRAHV